MRKAAEAEAIAAAAGAEHRASLGIDVAQRQAAYEVMLAQRQASRAKVRADHLKQRLGKCIAPHEDRTADEWAKLSSEAQRKAITRRRSYLKGIFSSHEWSMADVAHVLADLGRLDDLFNTSEVFGTWPRVARSLELGPSPCLRRVDLGGSLVAVASGRLVVEGLARANVSSESGSIGINGRGMS
jgi:hypothetical protein